MYKLFIHAIGIVVSGEHILRISSGKSIEVEPYAIFVAHLKVIFFRFVSMQWSIFLFYEFSIIFISHRIFTLRLPVDRTLRLEEVQPKRSNGYINQWHICICAPAPFLLFLYYSSCVWCLLMFSQMDWEWVIIWFDSSNLYRPENKGVNETED